MPPRAARIIPARAGFTAGPRHASRGHPDHPRSRGVYRVTHRRNRVSDGSSPLARGLQTYLGGGSHYARIIPARAGFTTAATGTRRTRTDHPRSRGVYAPFPACVHTRSGSSPLARGLPRPARTPRFAAGIIPARAGFTSTPPTQAGRSRDHPRSRGVYAKLHLNSLYGKGSSPLARGLRRQPNPELEVIRIIPARAGFTRRQRHPCHAAWDHPRSRGVYVMLTGLSLLILGSSPLARGLPQRADESRRRGGIIPARAGFTSWRRSAPSGAPDHPRSRGVYQYVIGFNKWDAGSSPLARGLPTYATKADVEGGIIPARAGFTACAGRAHSTSGDHPRSRGVYVALVTMSRTEGGSSPLARGLQEAQS